MPAKSVVFTTMKKFDGTDFRLLTSGDYIQVNEMKYIVDVRKSR